MGFDVTLHPTSEIEITRYVFDVIADPTIAQVRAVELTADAKQQQLIMQLYGLFPRFLADFKTPINNTFAFVAAAFAGYKHPFWYMRDAGLTLLAEGKVPELKGAFVGIESLSSAPHGKIRGKSFPLFHGNESASGFILPSKINEVRTVFTDLIARPGRGGLNYLETLVDDESIDAITNALDFCEQNHLGLIEATEIVVPVSGQSITEAKNMRANFLGNR